MREDLLLNRQTFGDLAWGSGMPANGPQSGLIAVAYIELCLSFALHAFVSCLN